MRAEPKPKRCGQVALRLGLAVLGGCAAGEEDSPAVSGTPTGASAGQTQHTSDGEDESDTDPHSGDPTTPDPTSGPVDEPTGSTGADDNAFVGTPDASVDNACDIWEQDCPKGEKCMPWANDGGTSWNATKCTAVSADADQVGDPCTVEGSGVSGVDSCETSSMCWAVDETNMGVCVGFCHGTPENPICDDPTTGCAISNDGVLILCTALCDPMLQDCPDTEACYPEPNGFFCSPDVSGPEDGGYSSPCAYINHCDPGLWCAVADAVPGCASAACCSEFCEHEDPDATCMGSSGGQACVPYFEDGDAPPGHEDVGVCVVP